MKLLVPFILFATGSMAVASPLSDQELSEVRGGMTITSISKPSFDSQGRHTTNRDNFRVQFTFTSSTNFGNPILAEIYSGNTKTGKMDVPGTPIGGNLYQGAYDGRVGSHPISTAYNDFHIRRRYPNDLTVTDVAAEGTYPNPQMQRSVRLNPKLTVFKVWFHMMKGPNPNSPRSWISEENARSLVDSMSPGYTQTKATQSADVYSNKDCPVKDRLNFRFHALDTVTVPLDAYVTGYDYRENREAINATFDAFVDPPNALDPDYLHVFLTESAPLVTEGFPTIQLDGYANWNKNWVVLNLARPLGVMAGVLPHEFGHATGKHHVNWYGALPPGVTADNQHDDCPPDSTTGNQWNYMCRHDEGHGVFMQSSQCVHQASGVMSNTGRRVIDFNN